MDQNLWLVDGTLIPSQGIYAYDSVTEEMAIEAIQHSYDAGCLKVRVAFEDHAEHLSRLTKRVIEATGERIQFTTMNIEAGDGILMFVATFANKMGRITQSVFYFMVLVDFSDIEVVADIVRKSCPEEMSIVDWAAKIGTAAAIPPTEAV